MTTFKQYAKQAKERMKNGFWENAKANLQQEKQVAATMGLNERKVAEVEHKKLHRQIYDYDGFCQDEVFFERVVEILTSKETVLNPIMRLADKQYMEKLSPTEKQQYISKLALKYSQAVEKYNQLHS